MLDGARERIAKAGLADRIELQLGSAETLDFAEGSFDALTTGYLLRYLDDPLRTMSDLIRLIRPGAPFALLDFAVPPNLVARGLWHLYTGVGLPVLGRLVSPGWAEVGRYLRPEHPRLRRRPTRRTRCARCWSRRAAPTSRCAG